MIETAAILGPATVTSLAGGVRVALADGTAGRAQMAMAVAYEPAVGDRLLVIGNDPSALFVIGVVSGRGKIALRAEEIELEASQLTIRAGKLECFADRVVQKAKDVYHWIEGLFQVRSKRARHLADESHDVQAGRAYIQADAEVVVDGRTIHLG